MRTQVVLIGGGPSGLLLGQVLHKQGVEAEVLELTTRAYVLGRVRAVGRETGHVGCMEEEGTSNRQPRDGEQQGERGEENGRGALHQGAWDAGIA